MMIMAHSGYTLPNYIVHRRALIDPDQAATAGSAFCFHADDSKQRRRPAGN
jgi:hypothetical protein